MNKKFVLTAIAATTMLILGNERASSEPALPAEVKAVVPQVAAPQAVIPQAVLTHPPMEVKVAPSPAPQVVHTAPVIPKIVPTVPQATMVVAAAPKSAQDAAREAKEAADFQKQVLLKVNGQPITGGMLSTYLADRMQKMPNISVSPQMQNMVLNELITVSLLSQAARTAHIDSRPEIKLALTLQQDMLLSRLALQEQAGMVKPSEEELKKIYQEQYGASHQEYKAAHILVKTEQEAKDVIAQLEKGTAFAVLAKDKSMDSNSKKGGDLGWFDPSQMVKPFSDAVATMTVGTFTHTPVQTKFGWHVIKLEDKRTTTPPTFESVKPRLTVELQRKALSTYLEQLRKQAKIEVVMAPPALPPTLQAKPNTVK